MSRLALRVPLRLLVLCLIPVALGLTALPQLPIERYPKLTSPLIEVRTSYSGHPAEDVDRQVTEVVEDALSGLRGVQLITSTSSQGVSKVSISLADNRDPAAARSEVERRLSTIRRRLPTGAGEPTTSTPSEDALPLMTVVLTSDRLNPRALHDLAVEHFAPEIQAAPGVAEVSVVGGRHSEIQVRVEPSRLQSRDVTLAQVQTAVRNWNAPSPAAVSRSQSGVFPTRTINLSDQLADLDDVVVARPSGGPVFLKDVAAVLLTDDVQTSLYRLNGTDAVALRITHQDDASTPGVNAEVRRRLDALLASHAPTGGLTATITNEQARLASAAVGDVTQSLYRGLFLTLLVVALFLHNLRGAFILMLALPAALVPVFFAMRLLGINLDTVSSMALVLVMALLLDDAIVVMESIYRRLRLGEPLGEASLHGLAEVGPATIAAGLMSVAILVPLAFVGGPAGPLFREFGLVAAVAAVLSLLVSVLVIPTLASRLPNPRLFDARASHGRVDLLSRVWERLFGLLQAGYRALLARALRFRWLPVMLGFVLFDAVLGPGFVRTEFAPREDENRFTLNASTAPGTALSVTDSAARIIEGRVSQVRDVMALATSVRDQSATIEVELIDKTQRAWSAADIAGEVRDIGLDIPTVLTRTSLPSPLGVSAGGGFSIMVRGPDLSILETLAAEVRRILVIIPGVEESPTSALLNVPDYRAVVDPQRAADLGVSRQTVAAALNAAVAPADASTFRLASGAEVDVVVQLDRVEPLTLADLGAMPIQTGRGTTIRLDQVATIVPGSTLAEINRYAGERQVSIEALVTGPPAEVLTELSRRLAELRVPAGYDVTIIEEAIPLRDAVRGLLGPLALVAVLAFVVLGQLYGSASPCWAVLLCLPVALVGTIFGLRMSASTVNVFSVAATILMFALAAKQAVLMVDCAIRLQERGIPRREAVLEASMTRLRPLLMTSVVMLVALWPLTSRAEIGAESRAPMAIAFMSGLVASVLVTLFMVPCLYSYLDDVRRASERLGSRFRRPSSAAPDPVIADPIVVATGPRPSKVGNSRR